MHRLSKTKYTHKENWVFLLNIDNILDKLGHSRCFTTLDLQSGFRQLRIKDYPDGVLNSRAEEIRGFDIHKTTFCTSYGTFYYVVMPFGLAGSFDYLSKICLVYLGPNQTTLVASLHRWYINILNQSG